MTTITVGGHKFELSYKFFKEYYRDELKSFNLPHYAYRVYVKRLDMSTPIQTSFLFHTSNHDWQQGKQSMDKNEIIGAFYCFLGDAHTGNMSLEEFLREFGYEYNRESVRIYNACKRSLDKMENLGIFESEIVDMLNEIQEKYPHSV